MADKRRAVSNGITKEEALGILTLRKKNPGKWTYQKLAEKYGVSVTWIGALCKDEVTRFKGLADEIDAGTERAGPRRKARRRNFKALKRKRAGG